MMRTKFVTSKQMMCSMCTYSHKWITLITITKTKELPLIGKSAPDRSTDGETHTFTGPPKFSATGTITLKNGSAETMFWGEGVGMWRGNSGGDSANKGSWMSCSCADTGTQLPSVVLIAECCRALVIITG